MWVFSIVRTLPFAEMAHQKSSQIVDVVNDLDHRVAVRIDRDGFQPWELGFVEGLHIGKFEAWLFPLNPRVSFWNVKLIWR